MVSTNRSTVDKPSVREQRLEKRKSARMEAHRQRMKRDQIMVEFQPDAVELELSPVPGGARWTLYVVIALLCFVVAWAWWAQVDKIVVAQGKLVTIEPAVVVQAPLASPVGTMNVKFGDVVHTNDLLATLDPTFPEADLTALYAKQKTLTANLARLNAERNSVAFDIRGKEGDLEWVMQYQAFLERGNEYRAKMNEFESQYNKLLVQEKNNEATIEQLTQDVSAYDLLEQKYVDLREKGSASAVDVLSRKIQSRDAKGKLLTSQSRSLELVTEKDALEKQKLAYAASWKAKVVSDLIESHQQLEEVEQQIAKAERMNEFVDIRVPANEKYKDFFVLEVAERSPGSVTQASEPLFKLIPVNAPMEVEIEVEGKDVGRIRIGSQVRIKLVSFPYQKHGTLEGTVSAISEGTLEKKDAAGKSTTMYRALVTLDDSVSLQSVPADFRLMPGMSVIAEIKVGKRRVLDYFLYPLIRYLDDSVREP
jgi:HlyD family secretion protein